MTFEEYNILRHEIIQKLADKYALFCTDVGDNIALIGSDFCILFKFNRGEVNIDYLLAQNGEIYIYPFNNFIVSSFCLEDRMGIKREQGLFNYSIADLKILERGLENNFTNILKGSKKWIESYKKSKYYYEPRIMNHEESIEIKEHMRG